MLYIFLSHRCGPLALFLPVFLHDIKRPSLIVAPLYWHSTSSSLSLRMFFPCLIFRTVILTNVFSGLSVLTFHFFTGLPPFLSVPHLPLSLCNYAPLSCLECDFFNHFVKCTQKWNNYFCKHIDRSTDKQAVTNHPSLFCWLWQFEVVFPESLTPAQQEEIKKIF